MAVSALEEGQGECAVIGTLFKQQHLKPSILKEISDEVREAPMSTVGDAMLFTMWGTATFVLKLTLDLLWEFKPCTVTVNRCCYASNRSLLLKRQTSVAVNRKFCMIFDIVAVAEAQSSFIFSLFLLGCCYSFI